MKLSELKGSPGARKKSKRRGRGVGSGHGKTSGRGHKGQKARAGGKSRVSPWFEGGQMPLSRRVPIKGFRNFARTAYEVINIRDLERSGLEGTVTVDVMKAAGIIQGSRRPIKVLAVGELSRALDLKVNAISKKALEKITQAGGTVELVK
jgi:large subunit ribosomal protein L15